MNTVSRQVSRQQERRAGKMAPNSIPRTSTRHMGLTKGMPYSRKKLIKITPSQSNVPAVFHVSSYGGGKYKEIKATATNLEWFMRGLTPSLKMSMLGMY
jgi:hypothetical protein